MRITASQLRRIIKEEVSKVVSEVGNNKRPGLDIRGGKPGPQPVEVVTLEPGYHILGYQGGSFDTEEEAQDHARSIHLGGGDASPIYEVL